MPLPLCETPFPACHSQPLHGQWRTFRASLRYNVPQEAVGSQHGLGDVLLLTVGTFTWTLSTLLLELTAEASLAGLQDSKCRDAALIRFTFESPAPTGLLIVVVENINVY